MKLTAASGESRAKDKAMTQQDVRGIADTASALLRLPVKRIWYSYDEEADILYLNFKKPSHADDSELTDDDVVVR